MNLSKEAIQEFREMRLDVLSHMLLTVEDTTKEAGAPIGDALLVRHELLEKQRNIKAKLESSAELDEEELRLLSDICNEEDEDGPNC